MSIEKTHIRALVAEDIGRGMEADLEAAKAKVLRFHGAHEALLQTARIVSDMSLAAKNELMDEKNPITFDPEDLTAVPKYVVRKMQEVVAKLNELASNAKLSGVGADGEVTALTRVVGKVKTIFDEEVGKLKAFEERLAAGDIAFEDGVPTHGGDEPRLVGTHPGPTLKMQRQAEALEQAEIDASKGNGVKKAKAPRRKKAKAVSNDTDA